MESLTRRQFVQSGIGTGLALTASTPVRAASVINHQTTPKTHVLFLDMQEIADLHGVVQSVCEAQKHPLNPVVQLGDVTEWDSMRASPWGVRPAIYIPEERIFKLWYSAMDADAEQEYMAGYAISDDGVHWEKPVLGLWEYKGSRNNNICHNGIGSVMFDPAEPDPARRYKMLAKLNNMGARMGYSPDGMRWDFSTQLDMNRMLSRKSLGVKGKFQSPNVLLRDDQTTDPNRRYQAWWMSVERTRKPEIRGKEWVRTKSLAFSPDALQWTSAQTNPALTPNDSTEQENHHILVFPHQGYYIMLYEYGWFSQNKRGGPYGHYCADIRLAVSRDGENYKRILPHQKVISRGAFGEWDDGFLVIADKPAIKDDTIYLYYCGQDHNFPGFAGDMLSSEANKMRRAMRVSQTGLATLPMDRFTCLRSFDGETPGFAATQPLEVVAPSRSRLILNVSDAIPWRNWVDVEIVDSETGAPIPGYSREQCRPVCRDDLRSPVKWDSQATLAGVKVPRIALRFGIYGNAKLHSFSFTTA